MLCMLEYLNGWIGDRMRASITGAFGIQGEEDNGRRVVELCSERGPCMDNIYFQHKSGKGVKMEWRQSA